MHDAPDSPSAKTPHPTVSGKLILLGTAIGCVILFFVVWLSIRSVEHHLDTSRQVLVWADRAEWAAPMAIETTLVKPNAANAQYTYDKPRYRDPGFEVSLEEEQAVLELANIARSTNFTDRDVWDELYQLEREQTLFYREYLLATWYDRHGDSSSADEHYQAAFEDVPKVIVIQYLDTAGEPVAGLDVGTIEIGCDRVVDEKTRLDQRLVLVFPLQKTDTAGRVYLPVYDTTYRPVKLPQPKGYDITYQQSEGWFNLPSRAGSLDAKVIVPSQTGIAP